MAKKFRSSNATTEEADAPAAPTPPARRGAVTPAVGRNTGKTSGMRIMAFQDQTMSEQPQKRLTDEEIGKLWHEEFPDARAQFHQRMDIVRIVRRLFNEKRHGKQTLMPPAGGVKKYEIVSGKRTAVDEEVRGGNGRQQGDGHADQQVAQAADTGTAPRQKTRQTAKTQ